MKKIVLGAILGVFCLALIGAYFFGQKLLDLPASQVDEQVIYEVAPGLSFRAVAKDLEKKGLIHSAELFILVAKFKGQTNKMKVGEYALNRSMRPSEIMAVFSAGKSLEHKLTIAEGLSIFEIADLFEQAHLAPRKEFLQQVQDPQFINSVLGEAEPSLEGYLFPETYNYSKFTDYRDILRAMVAKFKEVYGILNTGSLKGWDRHKIVTLASIIEKETGAPEERPLISSVFHNRIRKGMQLQTDPTIIYGKALETGRLEINITRSDLSRYTPYNTYVIKSLPPGPIANPGLEALRAAVAPANSPYLYFVSHNDGTHQFSEDYKAHLKAVQKFQLDPKARQGKSWRDLKKRDQPQSQTQSN